MKITDMKVNHRRKPLGCHFGHTVFSWYPQGECEASRLRVFEGDELLYDSGYGQLDYKAAEVNLNLRPRTKYSWQVYAKDRDGSESISEKACFETGKMDEPWQGKWITCIQNNDRHPVFFRDVKLDGKVSSARLYICGLGLYEAYYDHEKISDQYLTPYCNNYDNFLQAQTYDVTDLMQKDGQLEVQLGNGWYLGRFGFNSYSSFRYGKEHAVIAELHVKYEDGHEEVIATDESWKIRRSNITFSNIYDGEHRDDTLTELPEEECRIADLPAPVDAWSIPLTAHETFVPEVLHTPADETVFDLGQNIAGIFTFRVHEPKGTVIRLQAGEVLQNDCFYRDNLRTAKAEYVYVSDGNEHILRPRFTFYGYRYMKVEGVREVRADDFRGIALYSDFETIGTLQTGNEKVNQLIRNSFWGMKGNFLDVPTDCPQRDERMGWTGDAQVFSATAMYFADTYAFYRKYMHDMALEQKANDGLVPMVVPSFDLIGNSPMGATACVWGDATTIIPWNMYQFTGDLSILREHYEAMKDWIGYIRRVDGEDHGWRRAFHFGDWLALDGAEKPDAVMGGTEEAFIADVYYRKSVLIAAETAKLLGYTEDAEQFALLAEQIEAGLKEEYFTPSGRCAVMTQTGQIISLQNGLGSKEKEAAVLVKLLENSNRKLKTGFVGTPLLCDTLTMIGRDDLAYALLLNEEYPGWLYEVNLGATTVWERWNSVGADGLISSTGMNSLNHYSYGSVTQWIFERCAGLRALAPGFARARIAPLPHAALKEADMTYQSAAGCWHVSWKLLSGKEIRIAITVPYNAEAEVILPNWDGRVDDNAVFADVRDGVICLKGGSYELTYVMTRPALGVLSVDSAVGELTADPEIEAYLLAKMPEVGPIPLRTAHDASLRSLMEQYHISPEIIAEADRWLTERNS